jgi:hypothetical protein
VGFDLMDQLLTRFLHSSDMGGKNGSVHQLFIDFKTTMIQLGGKYCIGFSWCTHETSIVKSV